MPRRCAHAAARSGTRLYRDFRGKDLTGGHIDFENANGSELGIVGALYTGTLSKVAFDQWYRDTPQPIID